jgi:hypothetical protein
MTEDGRQKTDDGGRKKAFGVQRPVFTIRYPLIRQYLELWLYCQGWGKSRRFRIQSIFPRGLLKIHQELCPDRQQAISA